MNCLPCSGSVASAIYFVKYMFEEWNNISDDPKRAQVIVTSRNSAA